MDTSPKYVVVRNEMEWGEFFWRNREPKTRQVDGKEYTSYGASWCCVSSFGVFGCGWSCMGQPFVEFVADLDPGYLLGKISCQESDDSGTVDNIRKEVLDLRKTGQITRQVARDAWEAIETIQAEDSGQVMMLHLWESREVSEAINDISDLGSRRYPIQATEFVKKLWPLFVAEVAKASVVEPAA